MFSVMFSIQPIFGTFNNRANRKKNAVKVFIWRLRYLTENDFAKSNQLNWCISICDLLVLYIHTCHFAM